MIAYRRGIRTQTFTTTPNGTSHSAAFWLVLLVVAAIISLIPAAIASSKGRSFGLWFLFGFFCWLPALVASIVISRRPAPGAAGYGSRGTAPGGFAPGGVQAPGYAPPRAMSPPADWYPDPSGQASLRYWDGFRWTEHTR